MAAKAIFTLEMENIKVIFEIAGSKFSKWLYHWMNGIGVSTEVWLVGHKMFKINRHIKHWMWLQDIDAHDFIQ